MLYTAAAEAADWRVTAVDGAVFLQTRGLL